VSRPGTGGRESRRERDSLRLSRFGALPRVGIIGPGRAGLGLALALKHAGVRVLGLHGRRDKPMPRGLPLSTGHAIPWLDRADVVVLAVRDDLLTPLVRGLRGARAPHRGQVVLHLSGALSSELLAPLRSGGAAVGGLHPLMTVSADPRRAARHFRGATFAIEGDPAAVRAARRMVRALGGMSVAIAPGAKTLYHAGAVFASNYIVTLLAAAERLLIRAGFPREAARAAAFPLSAASVANAAAAGPASALTGPVARGDAATVRRHLAALPSELRALYRAVGLATLDLAREAGLSPRAARAVRAALARPTRALR